METRHEERQPSRRQRPLLICCSTPTIRSTGSPGARKRWRRRATQDKPILLSIGYSACHWCHVMAHESFEDADVAAVMNRLFVNIKVDREERPDLDQIYQTAHQMLTGRAGGWPLTLFLTPDRHAILRRHLFPEGVALRPARLRRAVRRIARDLAHAPRRHRRTEPRVAARHSDRARARSKRHALDAAPIAPLATRSLLGSFDRAARRFRRRAEVSAPDRSRPSCCIDARRCRTRARWRCSRLRAWRKAASTISSAAVSAATAWMSAGKFRISRRCSTTTARCSASMPTPGR